MDLRNRTKAMQTDGDSERPYLEEKRPIFSEDGSDMCLNARV